MPMKPEPLQDHYGNWTPLDPTALVSAHGRVRVRCDALQADGSTCGTVRNVLKKTLTRATRPSTSCGCVGAAELEGKSWADLAPRCDPEVIPGAVFGWLTSLTIPYKEPGRYDRVALCQCRCGTEVVVVASVLRCGGKKSCGCLRTEGFNLLRESTSAEQS